MSISTVTVGYTMFYNFIYNSDVRFYSICLFFYIFHSLCSPLSLHSNSALCIKRKHQKIFLVCKYLLFCGRARILQAFLHISYFYYTCVITAYTLQWHTWSVSCTRWSNNAQGAIHVSGLELVQHQS